MPATYDENTGTLTPTTPLGEGAHAITYTLTDPAGNESAKSPALNLTIDATAPGKNPDGSNATISAPGVTIAEATNGVNAAEAADGVQTTVTLPTGTVAGDVIQLTITDPSGDVRTVNYTVQANDVTNGSVPVTIPTGALSEDGTYGVSAKVTDAAGNSSLTGTTNFVLDTTAPTQVAQFTSMTKDSSSSTANADWTTADTSAGRLVSGTLSAPLAADEKLAVYSNGSLIGYATLNAARTAWAITDNNSYSSNWSYTAKVIDAAGNAGAVQTQTVVADTSVGAPIITGVFDTVSATTIANNGSTTNSLSKVAGTGEAGATIYLYDNSNKNLVGTTVVGSDNQWSVTTFTAAVGAGSNTFAALQVDTNANTSVLSNLWTVSSGGDTAIVNGGFDVDRTVTGWSTAFSVYNGATGMKQFFGGSNTYGVYSSTNTAVIGQPRAVTDTTPTALTPSQTGTSVVSNLSRLETPVGLDLYNNASFTGNVFLMNLQTGSAAQFLYQTINVVAGQVYDLSFDYAGWEASRLQLKLGDTVINFGASLDNSEVGRVFGTFTAKTTGSLKIAFGATDAVDFAMDNFYVGPASPVNDNTLFATQHLAGTPGIDLLSYNGGSLDTLGGNDTITASSTSLQTQLTHGGRITGSAGVDTLKLAAGTTLDLEALTNNQTVKPIQSIEVFTLQGTSTITLSANDVLSLGGANTGSTSAGNTSAMAIYSFASTTQTADGSLAATGSTSSAGKVQFVINGLSTDQVNLDALLSDGVTGQNSLVGNTGLSGQWDYKGKITLTGVDGLSHTYKVYDHNTTSAQVLIDSAANVTIRPAAVAPIVIDLNGDGTLSYTQQLMDVNTDGHLDHSAWAAREDGVLVWNKFGNGLVTDASQYTFSLYGGSSDLEGLRAGFDSNADGVLNAADAKFAEFGVWQDANGNGVSEVGEFKSLADLGVKSIDLTSDGVASAPATGVNEAGRTTVEMQDGSTRVAADAAFTFQTLPELNLDAVLHNGVADMTNGQTQLLKLTAADLLQLPANDSGVQELKVVGDSTDMVWLETLAANGQNSPWTHNGSVTQDGQLFEVYQMNAGQYLKVLLDQSLQVIL